MPGIVTLFMFCSLCRICELPHFQMRKKCPITLSIVGATILNIHNANNYIQEYWKLRLTRCLRGCSYDAVPARNRRICQICQTRVFCLPDFSDSCRTFTWIQLPFFVGFSAQGKNIHSKRTLFVFLFFWEKVNSQIKAKFLMKNATSFDPGTFSKPQPHLSTRLQLCVHVFTHVPREKPFIFSPMRCALLKMPKATLT